MEFHKIINLLDNKPNQLTKFRAKIWIEINYDSRGTYNTNSKIKFKSSILRSSLCDYSLCDYSLYLLNELQQWHQYHRQFHCAPSTDCISEKKNSRQLNSAKDIDVVMPMSSFIE